MFHPIVLKFLSFTKLTHILYPKNILLLYIEHIKY